MLSNIEDEKMSGAAAFIAGRSPDRRCDGSASVALQYSSREMTRNDTNDWRTLTGGCSVVDAVP